MGRSQMLITSGSERLTSQNLRSTVVNFIFISTGLSFPVFKGVMKKGYKLPTPIQRKVGLHVANQD